MNRLGHAWLVTGFIGLTLLGPVHATEKQKVRRPQVVVVDGHEYLDDGASLWDEHGQAHFKPELLKRPFAANELVVSLDVPAPGEAGPSTEATAVFSPLDREDSGLRIVSVEPLFRPEATLDRQTKQHRDFRERSTAVGLRRTLNSVYRVRFQGPDSMSPREAAALVARLPEVNWAEPNFTRRTQSLPNDPSYDEQWYLDQIRMPAAWNTATGSADVVVAIVDTGMKLDHEDLSGNLWFNEGEVPGDGIDNDGNGFIDDVNGWDFVTASSDDVAEGEDAGPEDNDPSDLVSGHGTAMAGLIGAQGNNGVGISGVAWQVSLMPLRAGYATSPTQAELHITDIARAITYAVDNGADIINMSFGSQDFSNLEAEAVAYAAEKGVLMVAAAGNDVTDRRFYPASLEPILAVAATAADRTKPFYSDYGLWVDLAAPGDNLLSTSLYGYDLISGTSASSAVVSGLAALMVAKHPHYTAQEVRDHLMLSAADISKFTPYYEGKLGAGLVDGASLLSNSTFYSRPILASAFVAESEGDQDGLFETGETIAIYPTVKNFGAAAELSVRLSTGDSWVEPVTDTVPLGVIGFNQASTNAAMPLKVRLLAGTPTNGKAELEVDILSGATVKQSSVVRFDVQPEFHQPKALFLPGNGSTELDFARLNDRETLAVAVPDNHLQVRFFDDHSGWSAKQSLGSHGNSHDPQGAASGGRALITYASNVGSWDNEIFGRWYDLQTELWSDELQLTDHAEIYGPNVPQVSVAPQMVAVQGGQFHLFWPDFRTADPGLYHRWFDGQQWQAEQLLFPFDDPTSIIRCSLQVFADEGESARAFLRLEMDDDTVSYLFYGARQDWSAPHLITSQYRPAQIIQYETDYYVPYRSLGAPNWQLALFRDDDWEEIRNLGDDERTRGTGTVSFNINFRSDIIALSILPRAFTPGSVSNWAVWKDAGLTVEQVPTDPYKHCLNIGLAEDRVGEKEFYAACGYPYIAGNGPNWSFVGYQIAEVDQWSSAQSEQDRAPTRPEIDLPRETLEDGTEFRASFTSNHPTGIERFRYAVGTAPGVDDVRPWAETTENGVDLDMQPTPMPVEQQLFFSVQAYSNSANSSPVAFSAPFKVVRDNCPGVDNPDQGDIDGDGIGDACDDFNDRDADGISDEEDNCPDDANATQVDSDYDGRGDVCDAIFDADADADGVDLPVDNCPAAQNPDQTDFDGDGKGDACDAPSRFSSNPLKIKNYYTGTDRDPNCKGLFEIDHHLMGLVQDDAHGCDLWRLDPQVGADVAMGINPGPASAVFKFLQTPQATFNGWYFFQANDGVHGNELWKTNGDEALMVEDQVPGSGGLALRNFAVSNGRLFFAAASDGGEVGLYSTAGFNVRAEPLPRREPGDEFVLMGSLFDRILVAINQPESGSTLYAYDGERYELVEDSVARLAGLQVMAPLVAFDDSVVFRTVVAGSGTDATRAYYRTDGDSIVELPQTGEFPPESSVEAELRVTDTRFQVYSAGSAGGSADAIPVVQITRDSTRTYYLPGEGGVDNSEQGGLMGGDAYVLVGRRLFKLQQGYGLPAPGFIESDWKKSMLEMNSSSASFRYLYFRESVPSVRDRTWLWNSDEISLLKDQDGGWIQGAEGFATSGNDVAFYGQESDGSSSIYLAKSQSNGEVLPLSAISGTWYDPGTAGQGLILNLLPDGKVMAAFYGFEPSGDPLWLVGTSVQEAQLDKEITVKLVIVNGGKFGGFGPGNTTESHWGELKLVFRNCNVAQAQLDGDSGQQQLSLQKLAGIHGLGCYAGYPPRPRASGFTGAWFDPRTPGQGFILHPVDDEHTIFAFYGFNDDSRRIWMIGVGPGFIEMGAPMTLNLKTASGGNFGGFNPGDVIESDWGELSITFEDCGNASATLAGIDGEQTLQLAKLTRIQGFDSNCKSN